MEAAHLLVQGRLNLPVSTRCGRSLYLISAATLASCWLLLWPGNCPGQDYSVLHHFKGAEGAQPFGGLALSGTTLYGVTTVGGGNGTGYGTVYKLNTDGTDFITLKVFRYDLGEGANPDAQLVISGTNIYGTTAAGGKFNKGTVFKLNTDGTGYALLTDTFEGAQFLFGGLVLSGNTLYGMTQQGGTSSPWGGWGTIFALNTDGTDFKTLHTFAGGDGATPYASLLLSGDFLYGTTSCGGERFTDPVNQGYGNVFKLRTDGSEFQSLLSFYNYDAYPHSGLTLSGSTLYGTTMSFLFSLSTDGSQPAVLQRELTNCYATLTLAGSALYGTTEGGGAFGSGTLFRINTNGTGYAILKSFAAADGTAPRGQLVLSGTSLYGTAAGGGSSDAGVVFRLSLAPVLVSSITGPDRTPTLRFLGFPGISYAIESAPEPTGPWSLQTHVTAPPDGTVVFQDPAEPSPERKFYRVHD